MHMGDTGKRYSAEQIVNKLREAEVELAKGQTIPMVAKKLGITDQTYYRWRREYGGLKVDQARRLKELEQENARLKRVVADQVLDMAILGEAAPPNSRARRGGGVWSRRWSATWSSPSVWPARCWARAGRRSGTSRSRGMMRSR